MNNLYFVTSNENKLREAENILQLKIQKIDLDIPEIQTLDVEEVVKDKACKAFEAVKKPVLVEDTGIYIKSWNGFPGALIKWVLKTIGNHGICRMLQNPDRTAKAKTSVCIYNGKDFEIFSGEVEGKIAEEPKGASGFGWDPIFRPDGYDKTFAEIPKEEKNKISMRKIALMKMKEYLDKNQKFLK